jgi:SAM-dependent methyltransferase
VIPGTEILTNPRAYLIWQGKFAEQKLASLAAHNDLSRVRRVLDVGCGPGTNTGHFAHSAYLGVDINSAYVEYARRKYGREFLVSDVCKYTATPSEKYDFILINSFLHHIDGPNTRRILEHLSSLVTPDGHVHIIEPVMPPKWSVAQQLAKWDRGDFVRPLEEWKEIIAEQFDPVVFEIFELRRFGITLWQLLYCKCRPRSLSGR